MIKRYNSIDCILDIQGTHTVLVKRKNSPFKGSWALPGGRQEGNESLDDTVIREIREETNLEIDKLNKEVPLKVDILGKKTFLNQMWTYDSGTDPRGGNTTVYTINLNIDPSEVKKYIKPGSDTLDVAVVDFKNIPKLAFDHFSFLRDYFKKFKRYSNPTPTTDIVIEYNENNEEKIVLIKRKNNPYKGCFALPGGYSEYGITAEQNAEKEAKEETNLDILIYNPERPLCVKSNPNRDPRGHLYSLVYVAKGEGKLIGGDDAMREGTGAYSIPKIKELIQDNQLAFDHGDILSEYLRQKKY